MLFYPAACFTLLENMKIWCNILSLYILICREYRAGDTLSMQLLTSIHSHFASLLTAETSSGFLDKSPSEKFENIVRNVTSSLTLDNVVTNLISAGNIP